MKDLFNTYSRSILQGIFSSVYLKKYTFRFMPKSILLLIKELLVLEVKTKVKIYAEKVTSQSIKITQKRMYKENNNINIQYTFAIIPLVSSFSFGLHYTLDSLTSIFSDRQLGGVILGVSIFSFSIGLYAPSIYSYFFPPISSTIPVSPPLVEKTDSMLPSQDVLISSIPSDTVSLKITDLEFIRDTLFQSASILTNNHILLTNILKARLSRKFTLPSNLVVRDTIEEIPPVLDEVDLAFKFLDNQLTITSQIDPSIVSTIVN